jgi:hypothetical protein
MVVIRALLRCLDFNNTSYEKWMNKIWNIIPYSGNNKVLD